MSNLIAVVLLVLSQFAMAGPSRIVVGFPAGGAADSVARVIASELGMVVENRPGASSTIAAEFVARSKPDGKTLFFGTNTAMVAAPHYMPIRYDPATDFSPVCLVGEFDYALLASLKSGAKTIEDIRTLAITRGVLYGHSNSVAELAALQLLGGLRGLSVPYKGDDRAYVDLMAGDVTFMFSAGAAGRELARAGRLVEIPYAMKLSAPAWAGLFAPAGAIPDSLPGDILRALRSPAVVQELARLHFVPAWVGPSQFSEFMVAQRFLWRRLVEDGTIKMQ
ncbi:PBP2_Bug_TTT domain containing protein [uncultured Caudovirales phage]|uniref:PBP2_Bug_TTT domain containing protein n=1 Tax=uncultured Caudovirales phage TaxID=2100421 RepID=A0A6J5Q899_9CAUD|nr:PBP2_Bug_TTT domain containing protein [uncultured Caudovirales phage]